MSGKDTAQRLPFRRDRPMNTGRHHGGTGEFPDPSVSLTIALYPFSIHTGGSSPQRRRQRIPFLRHPYGICSGSTTADSKGIYASQSRACLSTTLRHPSGSFFELMAPGGIVKCSSISKYFPPQPKDFSCILYAYPVLVQKPERIPLFSPLCRRAARKSAGFCAGILSCLSPRGRMKKNERGLNT